MDQPEKPPLVSVIVPARNEEQNIADCLHSLLEQGSGIEIAVETAVEIIVADYGSEDKTAAIVAQIAADKPHGKHVKLVSVPPLPQGWVGKNHALHAGVRHSRGEWLLFTDADTLHVAGKLPAVIERAQREDLSLLSFSPRQEVRTWWERAVIPALYEQLAKLYPYERVNDPADSAAAANGQYILFRREAYFVMGGHEAVRDAVLEDVELARRTKQAGFRIWFGPGEGIVSTRMYRCFGEMWEGWTKNLFLLYHGDSRAVWRTAAALLGRYLLPSAAGVMFLLFGSTPLQGLGLAMLFFAGWQHVACWRKLGKEAPVAAMLCLLPGALLISLLLLNSERRYRRQKGIRWKGRRYRSRQQV